MKKSPILLFSLFIILLFCVSSNQSIHASKSYSVETTYSAFGEPLNFQKILILLELIPDRERREEVGMELASLVFDSEESLSRIFPDFVKQGFTSKQDMLNEYVNNVMPSIIKNEQMRYSSLSSSNSIDLLASNNNSDYCVKCLSLKNLAILMCNQHYPPAPGTCIECSFLRNLTNLLCNVSCETTGLPPRPCVKCGIYYEALQMVCGPPNCTNSMGPYYKVPSDPEQGFLHSRSLDLFSEIDTTVLAPVNCIPCYNIYTGYQLLCGDLFDYCPSPPPITSATPTPTTSSTPSASLAPSVTPSPSVSESPSATPSISESPSVTPTPSISESATPSPPPVVSPTPSPSQYYWYYYYNYGNAIEQVEDDKSFMGYLHYLLPRL